MFLVGADVSLAYLCRVGLFGNLGSEELSKESKDGSVGTYGLMDQRLAFEWVLPAIQFALVLAGDSCALL